MACSSDRLLPARPVPVSPQGNAMVCNRGGRSRPGPDTGILAGRPLRGMQRSMATVRPFRALRPLAQIAERVAAPPYDVIDTREARELARGNADSFLHVSRPEVDLPEGSDEHGPAAHALAHANLAAFEARGLLRADAEP